MGGFSKNVKKTLEDKIRMHSSLHFICIVQEQLPKSCFTTAIVAVADYCDSYVTEHIDFTTDILNLQQWISKVSIYVQQIYIIIWPDSCLAG
jgi:hypothetical protein